MKDDYFGCYALLPQYQTQKDGLKEYYYKVVGMIESNTWCHPPYGHPQNFKPVVHDHTEPVLRVICCGIMEEEIIRVAVKDAIKVFANDGETEIDIVLRNSKHFGTENAANRK